MKIINIVLCLLTALSGAFFCVVFFGAGYAESWKASNFFPGTKEYAILCILHFSLFLSLLCSVISIIGGVAGMVIGFIFKSWIRALIALGCCVISILLWSWIMEVNL